MLDIKRIREQPELVKEGIRNKQEADRVDELLDFDKQRRSIIVEVEQLKNRRNTVSQDIARLKKEGLDADETIAEMRGVSESIKQLDARQREVEEAQKEILYYIPNLPHESVPVGHSEDDNLEIRSWIPENSIGLNAQSEELLMDHIH